ncbi:MAG: diguanylate cyclase [Elusimicrobia bacterium GWA2_69_24]|nr:MAG: diguanylate cyclase [Elusimicrobia bacterium GWA2_69_24]HBL18179.1 diguanylate cyclase [Elusimicrobiota bacterium]
MKPGFWLEEFPVAVTVCDRKGKVLEMNRRSVETFAKSGGLRLLGTDLRACHPEPARTRLRRLLRSGKTNVYTISKRGRKKLIFQGPWYRNGRRGGLVELSIELPSRIPHFVRKGL